MKKKILSRNEGKGFTNNNVKKMQHMAHSPVMCEIEISNCQKINLIIAYCFIFVLREEHLENAFAYSKNASSVAIFFRGSSLLG